jgi:hypothetical protein
MTRRSTTATHIAVEDIWPRRRAQWTIRFTSLGLLAALLLPLWSGPANAQAVTATVTVGAAPGSVA